MKILCVALAATSLYGAALDIDAAKKAEQRECVACHGLRIVHSQRLSKATWQKELDKMAGWGAVIKDKELLLEYLSAEYSDAKPVPQAPLSSDGNKK